MRPPMDSAASSVVAAPPWAEIPMGREKTAMKQHTLTILVALTAAASITGCGAARKSALEADTAPKAEAAGGDAAALMKAANDAWAQRGDKAKLESAIASWKAAFAADPKNPEPLVRLSRAHYFLSDGHLRFDIADEDARKTAQAEAFGEGQFYGEKALLVMDEQFRAAREAETPLEEAIPKLSKKAVPAVYWWATNLGKWAAAEGFITLLAHKDQVFAMMDFCLSQDKEFFFAAPHRYFGAYYTKIPLPSGDKDKSRKHFDTAVAKAPNYLATRVLMAEYHAIKFQDREMYDQQLKYVMDASVDVIPELKPEHVVEKKKAERMIAEADDHFE